MDMDNYGYFISLPFLLTTFQRNDRPPPPPVLELKELKEEVPPPETFCCSVLRMEGIKSPFWMMKSHSI